MTFIRTRLFGKNFCNFEEIDEAEEEEEDNFDCGAINSQFAQPKLKVNILYRYELDSILSKWEPVSF